VEFSAGKASRLSSVLTIEIAMLRTGKEAGQTRVALRFSLQEFLRRYFTRADLLI
jgi:hypothetical protein